MILPQEVSNIIIKLQNTGFESYIVGGCVRDSLLKKKPNDWDVATAARPEEIQKLFPDSVYENQFGTVLIKTESSDPSLKIIEVTTFRQERKYSDKRHPDEVKFAHTIEEDLKRRDFTVNAIALAFKDKELTHKESKGNYNFPDSSYEIIDPFDGQKDLKSKLIRTAGNPKERFSEDALRLMRAVRFACQLDFQIEEKTLQAITENASLLQYIAQERIRDEFIKIMQTSQAAEGILLLYKTNLLHQFLPELEKGVNITQNKHHIYTVWEHLWRSLDYAAKKNYSLEVRLAALLHDIGKPYVKIGEGENSTFYNHEAKGAYLANKIFSRLHFSNQQSEKILKLIRYHGFVYDPEITTDAAIRRLLKKVGSENITELAQVREADRIGSGCPKAIPFRLRYFLFRIEKVSKQLKGEEPSLKMLALNGNDIIKMLQITPGPQVGTLLNILLEEVLDDPEKNEKKYLEKKAKELNKLSKEDIAALNQKAKQKYENLLEEREEIIKKKYHVN